MDHTLVAMLHLLLAGYWLGSDLAVYYLSGVVVDPRQPTQVRLFAAHAMGWLDMLPRTALILTLASGLTLTVDAGLLPTLAPWLGVLWLFAVAWLALIWAAFRWQAAAIGQRLRQIDFAVRSGALALCVALAWDAAAPGGLLPATPWLAGKLALMGLIVALGMLIRVQMQPFAALIARVASGAATATDEAALGRLIAQVKVPVWLIWIAVVAATLLGRGQASLL